MINVLYFASFRERLKTDSEELQSEGLANVGEVLALLQKRGGAWHEIFAEGNRVDGSQSRDS